MSKPRRRMIVIAVVAFGAIALVASGKLSDDPTALFERTFDAHWERLRDDYAYFDLYGVDWQQERAEHRPAALAAENADEFAWELARLISALPDPHVGFIPSMDMAAASLTIRARALTRVMPQTTNAIEVRIRRRSRAREAVSPESLL